MQNGLGNTPDPADYSYCGEPEPTEACEAHGYCDYHYGTTPGGLDPEGGRPFPREETPR